MYFATVAGDTFDTQFEQFPMETRGSPERVRKLIFRISFRTFKSIVGLPGSPCRLFHLPYQRNPLRRQAMTVWGFTISSAARQFDQKRESQTQSRRSAEFGPSRLP